MCPLIGNGISLLWGKVTLISGDTVQVHSHEGYITRQGLTETTKPRSAFHISVLCIAESLTRLACVINTTFREKIYSRWCCIDRLRRQGLSECGNHPSLGVKSHIPIRLIRYWDADCLRNGWEKRQFFALKFCRRCRKGSALKDLAGALHTDAGGCTLSVGRELTMEIPAKFCGDPWLEIHVEVFSNCESLEDRC